MTVEAIPGRLHLWQDERWYYHMNLLSGCTGVWVRVVNFHLYISPWKIWMCIFGLYTCHPDDVCMRLGILNSTLCSDKRHLCFCFVGALWWLGLGLRGPLGVLFRCWVSTCALTSKADTKCATVCLVDACWCHSLFLLIQTFCQAFTLRLEASVCLLVCMEAAQAVATGGCTGFKNKNHFESEKLDEAKHQTRLCSRAHLSFLIPTNVNICFSALLFLLLIYIIGCTALCANCGYT